MTHENVFLSGQSTRILPDWMPVLPQNVKTPSTLRDYELPSPAPADSRSPSPATPSSDGSHTFNPWPFAETLYENKPYRVLQTPSPTDRLGESIIVPIISHSLATGDHTVLGFVVAGLNPNRLIDDEYLTFYSNVAKQFEAGILNGKSRVSLPLSLLPVNIDADVARVVR